MITVDYVQTMARYNQWQNASVLAAGDTLDDETRKLDRGAHFGSIQATLNHLLWGDQTWLNRFAGTPKPTATSFAESAVYFDDWDAYKSERLAFDARICEWADNLDPAWLEGELRWTSSAAGRDITRPRWLLVIHLFNHQTHHRGQVHAMLTAAGATSYVSDVPFMPGA